MTSGETACRPGDELGLGRLVADLAPGWASAFRAVPRAAFLPSVMWAYDMETGTNRVVDRSTDPDGWEERANADVPLITQWDDGRHSGTEPGDVPTSSASMLSVVARKLRALDVRQGIRVLEIGTGTGWNAGLLASRLGDDLVTSVEVDARVAAGARAALERHALHPTVVCADGASGHGPGAPYDRVIATAGVRAVPAAWREQTRVGGLILAPWGTYYSHQEALVRLEVRADGSASGPFLCSVEFMTLRDQRLDWARFADHVPADFADRADRSETAVTLADLGDRYRPQIFVTGLCVPDCARVVNKDSDGDAKAWFFDLRSRSWAVVLFRDGEPTATVYQSGSRWLWDEVERALAWWVAVGRPGVGRFGLTVTADGTQQPWFDDEERLVLA